MKKFMIAMIVFGVGVGLVLPVYAQGDGDPAASALEYLLTKQNPDGGFGDGWTPESDLGTTADVVVAAVLAGQDSEAFFVGEMMNPLSYLGTQVEAGSDTLAGAGILAKVLMAVVAVGKDTDTFGGIDLVAALLVSQEDTGFFGAGAFDHCLSMIALQNAGVALPENAVETLLEAQNDDGGWGFMPGEPSDTNTTGMCLQSLALVEVGDEVGMAFDYLAETQNEDGGWPYQSPSEWGTDSDTNSTALVVGALNAYSHDLAEWNNPQEWLLSMQNDGGAFGYQVAAPEDNIVATVAVIPSIVDASLIDWALEAVSE